jgi:hypothetical protein
LDRLIHISFSFCVSGMMSISLYHDKKGRQ